MFKYCYVKIFIAIHEKGIVSVITWPVFLWLPHLFWKEKKNSRIEWFMAEPSCHMTVLSVKRYWLSSVISFSCSRRGGSSLKIGKFCKFFLRKRVVSITVIFLRRFNLPAMNWLRSKTGYKVYRKPWHVLIRYFCLDVILYSLLRIICLFR